MTSLRSLTVLYATWYAAVAVALVAGWAAVSDRLPDPLAVHWGPDGGADAALPSAGWLAIVLGTWLLGALPGAVVLKTTPDWGYRVVRRAYLVALLAGGGLVAGTHAAIITANLDAESWTRTTSSATTMVVVLLPAAVGAGVGWLLAGKDDKSGPEIDVPSTPLAVGDRVSWNVRVTARWALWLSVLALTLTAVTAGLSVAAVGGIGWIVPITLAIVAVAGSTLTSFTILIGVGGVLIRFGVLGWPVWRIRLDQIESASVQDRQALEVGGWGLRVTPYGTAIMLRSGECLVLKRRGRKNLYISVGDAATAAGVLNGLLERETATEQR